MIETEALQERARGHCEEFRCAEAVSVYEEIAFLDPENHESHHRLGICYSGLCREHPLTNPDIAVEHFRIALNRGGFFEDALLEAQILSSLGKTYLASHLLLKRDRLSAAKECHERATSIYLAEGKTDRWADEKFLLGNIWCEMPAGEYPEKWSRAVMNYENALQGQSREKDSVRSASILLNLGSAYLKIPAGNGNLNVKEAFHCFRKALRVFTPAGFPKENAAIHNNLGNAFLTIKAGENENLLRNARRGLRHFNKALKSQNREFNLSDYAVVQFNRGKALLQIALLGAETRKNLHAATSSFRKAEECCRTAGMEKVGEMARARQKLIRSFLQGI